MKLLLTGVSHKTAPVEVRESLAFAEASLPAALQDLRARPGVSEAVILSTSNRVEIAVTTEDGVDPQATVDAFLADQKTLTPASINPHLYRYEGREAIHHLFRVAASTWAFIEHKTAWISQPNIAISFFTWGTYLVLVFLRTTAGWRGRKAAIMTVAVLGFSAITWVAHSHLGVTLLGQ